MHAMRLKPNTDNEANFDKPIEWIPRIHLWKIPRRSPQVKAPNTQPQMNAYQQGPPQLITTCAQSAPVGGEGDCALQRIFSISPFASSHCSNPLRPNSTIARAYPAIIFRKSDSLTRWYRSSSFRICSEAIPTSTSKTCNDDSNYPQHVSPVNDTQRGLGGGKRCRGMAPVEWSPSSSQCYSFGWFQDQHQ